MKLYRKMTITKSIPLALCISCFFMFSCQAYLDKTVSADITEKSVFTTFPTFQGFIEKLHCDIIEFSSQSRGSWNYSDDIVGAGAVTGQVYDEMADGEYWNIANGTLNSPYNKAKMLRGCGTVGSSDGKSIWTNGWVAIRDANNALSHLDNLVDATQEERNVLEGQARFFRAYFHWQIMKQWGAIPYSETLFAPSDIMNIPQLSLYATAEKVLADFQKAADLLPVDWDAVTVGQATLGINRGRLTKGMAYGFMAEVQLYCGSPLFNGTETGSYTYNTDYCKKAAASAGKVIALANQGVYALEPWATYNSLFKTDNATEPGMSKEVIFKAPLDIFSRYKINAWVVQAVSDGGGYVCPTQNNVENFEMNNGLPINDPAAQFNPLDPWTNRDPRFRNSILVDQDRIVENRNDLLAFAQFYTGARDRTTGYCVTGFGTKKFTFTGWNRYDVKWGSNGYICVPILRMADIYLFYAEAANEGYGGPTGKDPNTNLTALGAVNIVRARANMPGVASKFSTQTSFRDRVWNERAVEFVFEGKRRDDLRRWHVAHLDKYKVLYSCEFNQSHTQFQNQFVRTLVFQSKHYWFPFPPNQVLLYKEWKQNAGW